MHACPRAHTEALPKKVFGNVRVVSPYFEGAESISGPGLPDCARLEEVLGRRPKSMAKMGSNPSLEGVQKGRKYLTDWLLIV